MLIKFIQDYIGRETAMKQYNKGDTGEFSFPQAQELIRVGVALEVKEAESEPPAPRPRKVKEANNGKDTS